jgi:N-acetylmuramoyl-L-alanine amidase
MRLIADEALAAATIWQEAAGEGYMGKVAVAEVIRNRAAQRYNSDGTIAGTIGRRYQFSAWNDDAQNNARLIQSLELDDENPIVQDCVHAWREAAAGSERANGAVLYANLSVCKPSWLPNVRQVAQLGNHTFFVEAK